MAFEAFFAGGGQSPRARRATLAISLTLHAGLVVLAIAWSFWHVAEITPPVMRVTFMAPPPPLPPLPPPPPGKAGPKKTSPVKERPKAQVAPAPVPELTPPETAIVVESPEPEGPSAGPVDGQGVLGDKENGDPNGHLDGVGGEPVSPVMMPPTVAAGRLLFAPDPQIPPALAHAGMAISNLVKVCVDKQGTVASATVVRSSDAAWDANVTGAVLGWKYSPYLINGNAVPFCYLARFVPRFAP